MSGKMGHDAFGYGMGPSESLKSPVRLLPSIAGREVAFELGMNNGKQVNCARMLQPAGSRQAKLRRNPPCRVYWCRFFAADVGISRTTLCKFLSGDEVSQTTLKRFK